MTDESRGSPLPQRERGATEAGAKPAPARVGAPVLPDDLRQRMKASVDAERAQNRERAAEMLRHPPQRLVGGERPDRPRGDGPDRKATPRRKLFGKADRSHPPETTVDNQASIVNNETPVNSPPAELPSRGNFFAAAPPLSTPAARDTPPTGNTGPGRHVGPFGNAGRADPARSADLASNVGRAQPASPLSPSSRPPAAGVDLFTPPTGSPPAPASPSAPAPAPASPSAPAPGPNDLPPGHPSGPSATSSPQAPPVNSAPASPASADLGSSASAAPSAVAPAADAAPADLAPSAPRAPFAPNSPYTYSTPRSPSAPPARPTSSAPPATQAPRPSTAPPDTSTPRSDATPAGRPTAGPSRRRWMKRGLVAGVLAVVAAVTVAAIMAVPGHKPAPAVVVGPAQQRTVAAWVVGQVDPATVVSCDPAMCAALVAHHYPSKNVRQLSSPYALKVSGVVVVTPAALELFGSSLVTAWAPAALATFGSGNSAVSVRIVAPHGATAYERAARKDQAIRALSEAALTQVKIITVSGSAAQELNSGQVDARLTETIAAAATVQPIHIMDFGNAGSGASADVPLRYVDLAVSDPASGLSVSAYVQALRTSVDGNIGPRPARTQLLTLPGGQQVLRVEFLAPSQFGVLNS